MNALITPLLIGLTIVSVISPLLTFSRLFQQKEWRLDRLTEHLRREGWFGQLFGVIRPLLVGVYLLTEGALYVALQYSGGGMEDLAIAVYMVLCTVAALGVLCILNGAQIILRRQRVPVRTFKALSVAGIAALLNVLIILLLASEPYFLLLPAVCLLQPMAILLAWLALLPLDRMLKRRIMERAKKLRSDLPGVTVIGIAGSVGKTTTKELLRHLLSDMQPIATPAHVNSEMGVAQWLLSQEDAIRNQHKPLLIVEMGAYRTGEIRLLCEIMQPDIGIVTAVGSDHLALFGSEDAIVEANGELLEALPKTGRAFLSGESRGVEMLKERCACPVTVIHHPKNVHENADGLGFTQNGAHFTVPLHGMHNAGNALLAMAAARHMGMDDARMAELLKSFRPLNHTFNVHTEQGVTLLDDTYNVSPLSFRAALNWSSRQSDRPRVLLTSGLLETGKAEERFLLELGEAAQSTIERVVFTTDRGRETFARGFAKDVELLSAHTEPVQEGSVLLCVGRMPQSVMYALLPENN